MDNIYKSKFNDYNDLNANHTLYAKWVKEKKEIPVLNNIDLVRDKNVTLTDIVYKIVDDTEIKMDIYLPKTDGKNKLPVMFIYFAGGWFMGDKTDVKSYFSLLTRALEDGYIVVCPNYRLATSDIKFPAPVIDCFDAIRYIVKYSDVLNCDVNCMGAMGPSAGGHLSLLVGFAQDYFKGTTELASYEFRLKFVVDMFGPAIFENTTMSELSLISKWMINNFIGDKNFEQKVIQASPSTYIEYNNPNVLIIHGYQDSVVPYNQATKIYSLMLEKNINAQLIMIEGSEHVFQLAKGYNDFNPSLNEVFDQINEFILAQINS